MCQDMGRHARRVLFMHYLHESPSVIHVTDFLIVKFDDPIESLLKRSSRHVLHPFWSRSAQGLHLKQGPHLYFSFFL
jgi:hypothetical protein